MKYLQIKRIPWSSVFMVVDHGIDFLALLDVWFKITQNIWIYYKLSIYLLTQWKNQVVDWNTSQSWYIRWDATKEDQPEGDKILLWMSLDESCWHLFRVWHMHILMTSWEGLIFWIAPLEAPWYVLNEAPARTEGCMGMWLSVASMLHCEFCCAKQNAGHCNCEMIEQLGSHASLATCLCVAYTKAK